MVGGNSGILFGTVVVVEGEQMKMAAHSHPSVSASYGCFFHPSVPVFCLLTHILHWFKFSVSPRDLSITRTTTL